MLFEKYYQHLHDSHMCYKFNLDASACNIGSSSANGEHNATQISLRMCMKVTGISDCSPPYFNVLLGCIERLGLMNSGLVSKLCLSVCLEPWREIVYPSSRTASFGCRSVR